MYCHVGFKILFKNILKDCTHYREKKKHSAFSMYEYKFKQDTSDKPQLTQQTAD